MARRSLSNVFKVDAEQAAYRELAISDVLVGRTLQHVLAPLDAGQDANSDGYFVVMPRAEGNLDEIATDRGPLQADEAINILRHIATGLQDHGPRSVTRPAPSAFPKSR